MGSLRAFYRREIVTVRETPSCRLTESCQDPFDSPLVARLKTYWPDVLP